jgi:hypothetical protein
MKVPMPTEEVHVFGREMNFAAAEAATSPRARRFSAAVGPSFPSLGAVSPNGACLSVAIRNGRACLDIPIIGDICIPVPDFIPSGTVAKACVDVCTKWGIPCGAKVTVTALGQQIAREGFGCC